jgi:acyl-CoA thioesterase-2
MADAPRTWAGLFDMPEGDAPSSRVWHGGGPAARMFGGQLIAQAMAAAGTTVPGGARPTSVHSLFLRPADASRPVEYLVEELRTGRAYCTRVTRVEQAGKPVMHATTQWHTPESWRTHNDVSLLPAVPGQPQQLPYPAPGVHAELLDLRWIDVPGGTGLWFRLSGRGAAVRAEWHTYIACYVSDLWLGDAALRRHDLTWNSGEVRASSLEHAVWIHRAVNVSEWVYIGSTAPVCDDGRGFVTAQLRTAAGELAMTIQQDVSIRSTGAQATPAVMSVGRER